MMRATAAFEESHASVPTNGAYCAALIVSPRPPVRLSMVLVVHWFDMEGGAPCRLEADSHGCSIATPPNTHAVCTVPPALPGRWHMRKAFPHDARRTRSGLPRASGKRHDCSEDG